MISEHLDEKSFEQLMGEALSLVPDTVDKRQGSIIYDTLAVSNVQLAQAYIQLKGYYLDSYALTAEGKYLELRVAEAGVSRYPATPAVKLGRFVTQSGQPASIAVGSRFSTAQDTDPLIYEVTAVHVSDGQTVPGSYRLTCETFGTAGNDYVGPLIPITHLSNVSVAEMGELLIPGRDVESDDSLRERYLEVVNRPAFGGNVAQYRQWVLEMDGVGAVQVYPVWNGGGTVKVSIIGADYAPASDALIEEVQTALDPESNQGEGLGLVPIGHVVTVSTPEKVVVDVKAGVTISGVGVSMELVQEAAEKQLAAYLLELRSHFGSSSEGNAYALNVYRARIAAAMMLVDGVENVVDVRINEEDSDLLLLETAQIQQLPVEGTVTLYEI